MKGKTCVVCGKRPARHYFGSLSTPKEQMWYVECDNCYYGWNFIAYIIDRLKGRR